MIPINTYFPTHTYPVCCKTHSRSKLKINKKYYKNSIILGDYITLLNIKIK